MAELTEHGKRKLLALSLHRRAQERPVQETAAEMMREAMPDVGGWKSLYTPEELTTIAECLKYIVTGHREAGDDLIIIIARMASQLERVQAVYNMLADTLAQAAGEVEGGVDGISTE